MERRRKRGETAAGEEATEKRSGFSTALSVKEVKDGRGGAPSSKRSKSNLVVRSSGEDEQVIRWDRILPRKLLWVLLVENDECTRHIVTALLKKCSYQVVAVADGLQAWEVLKGKHFNFDLVLTELVTPFLSGFGLLSKIMSNEISKNIPVVMMYSHDSTVISYHDFLGMVFKCILKGASDFLLKPVRNNELRNLWQHVWRKYCATLETVSDNVATINHGSSNAGTQSRTGDSSDEESDSQEFYSNLEVKNGDALKLKENSNREYENFDQEVDSELTKCECDVSNEKGEAKENTLEEMNLSLSIKVADSTRNILKANGFYNGSPCREENRASSSNKEGTFNLDLIGKQMNLQKKLLISLEQQSLNEMTILEDKDHAEDTLCKNENPLVVKRGTLSSGPLQLWELSLWRPQLKFNDD